jgi:hypothetical protein
MFKVSPASLQTLLTRRTVFSNTVCSIARSTFRMYSVMAIFKSSVVWGLFEYTIFACFLYCNHQVRRDILITLYCLVLKNMQVTGTDCEESLDTHDNGPGQTCRSCHKHEFPSMHDALSTGRHWLGVWFVTSLKTNLCTTLTTQNTTENNYVISHAQNTTALQPNVFSTGMHRLFTYLLHAAESY